MCCVAQEAGAPHPWFTRRTIMQFSHIYSSVTLQQNQLIFVVEMPANVITSHSKFQLNHTKCFRDMNLWRLAEFFLYSSNNKSCHKMQTHYPTVLKFGTQQDDVSAHYGIKFGYNTVNGHKVINNYSWKIASICCHAYKVNR